MLTGAGLRPRLLRVPDIDLRTLARAVCAPDMLMEDIGDVRLRAVMRPADVRANSSFMCWHGTERWAEGSTEAAADRVPV